MVSVVEVLVIIQYMTDDHDRCDCHESFIFMVVFVCVCMYVRYMDFVRRGSPLVIGVKSCAKFATDHFPLINSKGIHHYASKVYFCIFS